METIAKWSGVVALIILAIVYLFPNQRVGGVTNYDEVDATAIKIGGSNGSRVGPVISGTCSIVSDASISATTTGTGTCAATGTVAGDTVFVSLATTTTKMAAQWAIVGAIATTDSITVRYLNLTGTSAVPSATSGLGSSSPFMVLHPLSSVPGL